MSERMLRRLARLAAGGVLVLLLALLAGGYGAYRITAFGRDTFRPDTVPARGAVPDLGTPTTGSSAPVPTPAPLGYAASAPVARLRAGKPLTILLLGYGGAGHDGAYLTDSLEVARLDPVSGVVTLFSVPRDLWVLLPVTKDGRGGTWGKINAAYALGVGTTGDFAAGGALASRAVAQVLEIPIDYWVGLDFVGFRQCIDALGGVNVDVAQAFTDNHYPNNDNASVDPSYRTVHFDAGMQHLDGARAMAFARSRYAPQDGSDFGRSRRQQQLLMATARQFFSVGGLPRVFGVLDALQGHLHTSLALGEVRDLAGWAQEQAATGRRVRFTTGTPDTTALLVGATSADGQAILLPTAGRGNYSEIHAFVRHLLATPAAAGP